MQVAVKVLDKTSIQNDEDFERMSREIRILRRIRHSNCIQLYEIHESNSYLYFIMELPNGGELYDRIVENNR
jgi:serine/threonine protein kinase